MPHSDPGRTAGVPVHDAHHGAPVRAGACHVAPGGVQTTVAADRTFHVTDGRCAGDPLMASAADVYARLP